MLMQVFTNGLVAAGIYFLIGYSFALVYSVSRAFYFTHAIVIAAGAYGVFWGRSVMGLSAPCGICFGVMVASLLGVAFNLCIYLPLRASGASSLVEMVASLGLYVLFSNVIALWFGDYAQIIREPHVSVGVAIGSIRVTTVHIATLSMSIVIACTGEVVMNWTRLGLAMRAIACGSELSIITGIHRERVIAFIFLYGCAIAGLAGILIAMDIDMVPTMGMTYLLMGIVAFIVGGGRDALPIMAGSLLLGEAQHFGSAIFGAEWEVVIAFLILLLFLLLRPQGIMGGRSSGLMTCKY